MAEGADPYAGLYPNQPQDGSASHPAVPGSGPSAYPGGPVSDRPTPLAGKTITGTSWRQVPTKEDPNAHLWDVPGGSGDQSIDPRDMTDVLGVGRYIDPSTTPGPNVGTYIPVSQDESGNMRAALPNILRVPYTGVKNAVTGLFTEGPQLNDQGKLVVPGVQTDPVTGAPSLTPEAQAVGSLPAIPLRFSTPVGPVMPPMRTVNTPSGPAEVAMPSPSISDVYRGPLSTNADPVTASAIDMLKRATRPTDIPSPPEAFSLTPGPTPAPPTPAGGLLGVGEPRVGAAPPDTPILTAEDIRRASSQLYSPADRAAAQGTMLPDDTATAVRKLFSDTIPADAEQQRIVANQPAVQAARNVDPTGPMSFDTAMKIDRDLTDRVRAAKGTDRSELGQLQAQLRDHMDQIADQSPARQAYMQYIKQSQMEDIVHDASLRPDDKQDAYMRQRATSLASNENAMRNWTPEEQAALATVAKSGNIGMLGRLVVGMTKPGFTGLGAYLGSFFGPGGTIVGGAIGGDIGATQAAALRRYWSQTTLDQVRRQISAGVPNIPTPP